MLCLRSQVTELTAQLRTVEGKARAEREGLLDQLHHLTSDNTTNKLENQRLKVNKSVFEDFEECNQLREIKHYIWMITCQVTITHNV